MTTDIIYHDYFIKHKMSVGHPERPERLQTALSEIRQSPVFDGETIRLIEAREAPLDEVISLHSNEYLLSLKSMSERGGGFFTLDTSVNRFTYKAALFAAGGGLVAVDRVLDGISENAFVLCRPPGHHAEYDRAFGFCFINNVAVAANHLVRRRQLKRVVIIDYDAHHGNGTQNAFYSSDEVLYIGLHQDGRTLFPGSGFVDEMGRGKGYGYTVNIPMYPGAGHTSYRHAFEDVILPLVASFRPQFVLASVGFDCHFEDPLTNLGLTLDDISMMNNYLCEIASNYADGHLVAFLEGGYNLDVVGQASRDLVERFAGTRPQSHREEYRESKTCIDYVLATIESVKDRQEGILL